MAEGTGPDAVTGARLRSRGGSALETAPTTTTAEPPGSAPSSPGLQTQAGASTTSALATTPMYLSERNADTSAQSFGAYCENGYANKLY